MAQLVIEPIASALGAEVAGVDLAAPVDDATIGQLRAALLEHGVLVLRDQHLQPRQQLDFVRRLGPIHFHPHVGGLPDLPEVMEILKTETDTENFGAGWHTDQMFLPEPAMATCLYALEVPRVGGDTLFACMRAGYRALSVGMQSLARRLRTVNLSVAGQLQRAGASQSARYGSMRARDAGTEEPEAVHPLVRTHPETGDDVLYVGLHTMRFEGMTTEESRPLLELLTARVVRPEHICRVRWRPGSLALWDNRRVLHNALNDYPGKRRRMHRITVAGDAPFQRERDTG
ncbi:MAG: TauD/TfdA family dioxygenase [Ectothiorhodospiraceae bacterium]|nr:TauD/TfdA family dioxygenase [Ectothiorhodospiraceae bacterium]